MTCCRCRACCYYEASHRIPPGRAEERRERREMRWGRDSLSLYLICMSTCVTYTSFVVSVLASGSATSLHFPILLKLQISHAYRSLRRARGHTSTRPAHNLKSSLQFRSWLPLPPAPALLARLLLALQ